MASAKIAITLEHECLKEIDLWVSEGLYPNRSKAIQEVLKERIARWRKNRLQSALSQVVPEEERKLSEEGFDAVNKAWEKY
ncbi:MAG: CopG family transcriptional regulator [Candidatus Eremiobacteraeota bacterium]|nr:CopG family transcriptional regulator [Candidatus Eremiobacteraeota bacterium]